MRNVGYVIVGWLVITGFLPSPTGNSILFPLINAAPIGSSEAAPLHGNSDNSGEVSVGNNSPQPKLNQKQDSSPGHKIEKDELNKQPVLSRGALLLKEYTRHSVSQNPEFVKYLVSIIAIESSHRPVVISNQDAYGLMQVTRGAAIDASRYCKFPLLSPELLLFPSLNIEYGSCYLLKLTRELRDWNEVLIVYNGGYRALTSYRNGGSVPNETAQYVLKVQRLVNNMGDK